MASSNLFRHGSSAVSGILNSTSIAMTIDVVVLRTWKAATADPAEALKTE